MDTDRRLPPSDEHLTVFRRRDMLAAGIDPALIRSHLAQGVWTRLHHGVYASTEAMELAARDPVHLHRFMARAAILALPDRAYTFGRTAALARGLPIEGAPPTTITLVRPIGTDQRALQRRITGPTAIHDVRVHSHRLTDRDVEIVAGLPTVTLDIAAVSAAACQSPEWAVAVLDAAAWGRPDSLNTLREITEEWPRLRGIGGVRQALPLVRTGAQSPLESISRVRLVGHGLPEPQLQRAFHDASGLVGYADMSWDDGAVIGECDGLAKYDVRDDVIREKLREDRLRELGSIVVRWTWKDMMATPAQVAARIQRARLLAAHQHRRTG